MGVKTNSTGFKGVHERGDKYHSLITYNGRRYVGKMYDTPQQAREEYKQAQEDLERYAAAKDAVVLQKKINSINRKKDALESKLAENKAERKSIEKPVREILTQDQLKRALKYDPETGIFTRVKATSRRGIGSIAGYQMVGGATLFVNINNKRWTLHKLAVLYMTGKYPELDVNHINRDLADNKWSNLRLASKSDIAADRIVNPTRNKTGFAGVTYNVASNYYYSSLKYKGKTYYTEPRATAEQASEDYKAAKLDINNFVRENEILRAVQASDGAERKTDVAGRKKRISWVQRKLDSGKTDNNGEWKR